jgi:choline dehydrogenase-like flavoprotein
MINNQKKIIIVGGGTAGAIVAKNLSSYFDVTVIDKSRNVQMPLLYQVPLMIGLLFNRHTNHIKKSTIRFNNYRHTPFFHPNLIGGTSIINGCVHVMGSSTFWRRTLKHFGLAIDDLQKSYQSIFSKTKEAEKIHLTEAKKSWVEDAFFDALKEKSIDQGDVEWTDAAVSGMVYNTVKRYLRSSVLNINPFRKSKLIDEICIERLVVNSKFEIVGVFDGRSIVLADYVFLCAGVIGTNKLLMREALRIEDNSLISLELDAGRIIRDHVNLRVNVKTNKNIQSLNEINASIFNKAKLGFKHALGIWTLMRGTGATATANIDLDGDGVVDTRINLLRFYEEGRMGSGGQLFPSNLPGFSISITKINPESSGRIELNNSEVEVMPNYLTSEADIEHMEKALDFILRLLETDALSRIIERVENIDLIKSNPVKYIQDNGNSGYHLIGGCSHLLGEDFQVGRFDNLYICDASAISEYVSPNIHSTVVILADLCSKKFIRKINKI